MTNQALTYHVDMVLCIDCTGSMRSILQSVKESAGEFHKVIGERMSAKGKFITGMRVRVVAFRDIFADDPAIEASGFFDVHQDSDSLKRFLDVLKAKGGGGDGPESALEALSIALNSPWHTDADRLRHVVVMWTDAPAHPLENGVDQHLQSPFGAVIAANLDQLSDWWNDRQNSRIRHDAKRLVLFAPEKGCWLDIAEHWENTVYLPSLGGKGLTEFEFDQIIEILANTI